MADNLPEKLKNKAGDILTQVVSDIKPDFLSETDSKHYHDWFNFVAPYLIMAVVIWIMFYCCCCRGDPGGKLMNAPGRPGVRIRRDGFERNTREYFRNNRGHSD
ncbi:hypothetical protein CTI12_AA268040 [Artemisia annua]|uniref:Uncharacterized protein n=1 Tax=Artemisia annua TaxID=35608 RepID=A0A2U1KBD6_ARTAN|nr:hypothetical protein CTI12_AA622700 [Artemisia annua]PWA72546.1 hypothetical protein CTI12_AA268040 [Artemisia annua]